MGGEGVVGRRLKAEGWFLEPWSSMVIISNISLSDDNKVIAA